MSLRRPVTDDDGYLSGDELPDQLRFLQILWEVVHGVERMSKSMRARIGITGPQRVVLRVVDTYPGISGKQLARLLHVHPSTLTGILRRLEAKRLLRRVSDPLDRRKAVLSLTAGGAALLRDNRGSVEGAVAAALKRISLADRECTRQVLHVVAEQLLKPPPRR